MRSIAALLACTVLPFVPGAAADQAPRVIATIPPVHALAAEVMAGRGEPELLVRGNASPHGYQLRPSDARALQEADVIIRIGPALESFLERPLMMAPKGIQVITLMEAPGVRILPAREGGVWSLEADGVDHDHDAAEEHAAEPHDHGPDDAHIWLSPRNAQAMVDAIAQGLAAADPDHGALYLQNAARARADLAALDQELEARLAPVREKPFVVFHDAYQYLEVAYGLRAAGAITVSPDRPPSARRLADLARKIDQSDARCVFGEVQTSSPLAATLADDLGLGIGQLDPEGTAGGDGPGGYARMMRHNVAVIVECLSR